MLNTLVTMILVYSLTAVTIHQPPITIAPTSAPGSEKTSKRGCSACSSKGPEQTIGDRFDSLATLGRRSQVTPLMPIHGSVFSGTTANYVSTATGQVSFAINDLGISGSMPLVFQRVYTSARTEDFGLGAGWSFILDDRIRIDDDSATLSSGDGLTVAFRANGSNRHFTLKVPSPGKHQSFEIADQDTIVEDAMGTTRTYKKVGDAYRLSEIVDPNGNRVAIGFDSRGNLAQIAGTVGAFTLHWSDGKASRLLAVTDSAGRRLEFKHDGRRLREVKDVLGNRWSYDYSNERLTAAFDPLGRNMLRARYDRNGRAVEVGEPGASYVYAYGSGPISRRTLVTDPFGVATFYEHNKLGATVAVGEDGGPPQLRIDYTETNRPTRLAHSTDGDTTFVFDSQNRLIQSSSSGVIEGRTFDEQDRVSASTQSGVRDEYSRDARGRITAIRSSEPGRSSRSSYNAAGQVISVESDNGRKVTNEYDSAGRKTAFTVNGKDRFETRFDGAGNVALERFPSGLVTRYERDARGRLTKQTDSDGRTARVERDPSGALAKIVKPDGSWIQSVRDQSGRIVAMESSSGRSRRFGYDARGALIDYVDGSGQHKRFEYDRRGRLSSIQEDSGKRTAIERDDRGRIDRISVLNLNGSRFDYDRSGRLVAFEPSLKKSPAFVAAAYTRAASSRLVSLAPQDPGCMFGYDPVFDASQQGWNNCWDPFGGFGGFGGGGFGEGGFGCDPYNPFGSGCGPLTETHEQCLARQDRICIDLGVACVSRAMGAYSSALAVCFGVALVNPGAGAICAAAAETKELADVTACGFETHGCHNAAPDKCPH